jgi:hypothetical protein
MAALLAAILVLAISACADEGSPSIANAGTPATGGVGGQGGAASLGPVGGNQDGSSGACTPNLAPGDEFFVPCDDAGEPQAIPDASIPGADASMPDASDHEPDARVPEPDASGPLEPTDEGMCAERDVRCDVGHAETTLGSATCTINAFGMQVEREICEACGKDTAIIDFALTIMDCNACFQVYREGGLGGEPIGAGECRSRSDALINLAWSAADPSCVDVYAYTGSGTLDGGGAVLQVADQVRVCRCDRTTDTCVSCIGGACDEMP